MKKESEIKIIKTVIVDDCGRILLVLECLMCPLSGTENVKGVMQTFPMRKLEYIEKCYIF